MTETVLVTGAAQGLGRAVACAFHAAGAELILLDNREAALHALAVELGVRVSVAAVDLTDAAATQATIAALDLPGRGIGTLIHNAAILLPEPFATLSLARWRATLDVGLQAAFLLTQAVWPGMVAAGGGSVIYVSSRSGIEGFVDETAYCTAKHGLEGLMKCLAMEGEPHGIRANTVTPGHLMHTPMSERVYTEAQKQVWVEPAVLAPAFLHLADRGLPNRSGERMNAWELAQAIKG
jgi:NAD(P)-dependent dehydrogenase (short-subunit alcohol dehydrogenase family)